MFVCVCNAIRDRQVRAHVGNGATTPGQVFRAEGCRPNCGSCVDHMRDVIADEASPAEFLEAAE